MQHRGPRWAAFVAFVAITALLGRLITCSRGETFWLLFPVWALAGSRGLDLVEGAGHGGAAGLRPGAYGVQVRRWLLGRSPGEDGPR